MNVCILKMLYFDRIDVLFLKNFISEKANFNKTSASKESEICHYWYFLNFDFKFQSYVYNRCHDLLMTSMNFSKISILVLI